MAIHSKVATKKKKANTAIEVLDNQTKFVAEEYERYKKHWRDEFKAAEAVYDLWCNKPPTREQSWQNQVNVPVVCEAEQTISPRLFTALFPNEAPLDVHVEGQTPAEQGILIKGALQHYFRISDVQGESIPALGQTTLFGTGYIYSGWMTKRGWQTDADGKRYSAIIENRPDCEAVDFFEMFPHPAKLHIGDGLPVIRKRLVDSEYLKALKDNPFFETKDIEAALQSTLPAEETKDDMKPGEAYELLEYWGPWNEQFADEEGRTMENKGVPYWIMVINRTCKIRGVPNPFNHQQEPFCKLKLFESPKPNWFGVGIGKMGKSSADRLNKIVNQRLDNVDLVLNKQGAYNGNDPLISIRKLQVSKPGQWHKVSDTVQSLRWIDTPDVTASSYKEEELAKQDFREATGATAHLMPEQGSEHRTAMGIQLLQGAAGMRFRPVLRRLETDFIQALAMIYFSNLKQFMTVEEWVTIVGDDGIQTPMLISPEDINAKVYFVPTGISETMNKETQVGQLLRYKEVTANDPTVNRQEINKRIAELFGFKDVNKLTISQPMVQPGQVSPQEQAEIRRRLAEGATPTQVKQEIMGPRPQGQ